ncbi:hypothetical protein [Pseudomonas sp. GM18]|uniref:hypothetical protein n=1 Tax=Pseudomonas sp. GM18 TaxID=1144324 RepID=UPI000517DBD5|nr:hypothetical protein [Pseudomonas sp. GM18]
MTKKLHLTISSGSDQNGEWHSASACHLDENSDADWNGTRQRDQVTCKRCLTQMAKPKAASTIGLHKERPMLFSGPMVRAILEGRKTVTRRPLKGHHIPHQISSEDEEHRWMATVQNHPRWGFGAFGATEAECVAELAMYGGCPYGNRGDRLWVRETCFINDYRDVGVPEDERTDCEVIYRADGVPNWEGEEELIRWRPSIHMPRWASRILLEITDVRAERLQDISDEQAEAEGCFFTDYGRNCFHDGGRVKDVGDCPAPDASHPQRNGWAWDKTTTHEQCLGAPRWAFANLWNSTGGDWDTNPWVWVVEFKRVTP